VRSTNYQAPHYVVFSIPVTLSLTGPNILLSNLLSNTLCLPQCEWPSFTPIQNNMQTYSSASLNLYTFRWKNGKQKILYRM